MNIPGLTADASLDTSKTGYRRHVQEFDLNNVQLIQLILPQARMRDWQHYACMAAAGMACNMAGPLMGACMDYVYDGCMGGFAF